LNRNDLIKALEGTAPVPYCVVDEQTAGDIMNEILKGHRENAWHYDLIAGFIESDNVQDACRELWDFCRDNLTYYEESGEYQYVYCPLTILVRRRVDCKNYAGFIAGMLDALKRKGWPVVVKYRFVSYEIFNRDPHHVFVVCNPNTDDIWIDPVLGNFDEKLFYWYKVDRMPRGAAVGAIGRVPARMGTTDSENALLSEVKAYSDALSSSIGTTLQTGTFNNVSSAVLQGAALALIPGGAAALAALKAGAMAFDNAFGVGAASSRILTDISNLNVVGLWNDILGRTYNTDQYWAAVYYKFYVLGQNVTDINHVSDSDILPALKWFIDRTGVFISGRQHIIALTQSPGAYMAYYSANSDTTTDPVRVQAAYLVGSKFWMEPGNFSANLLGAWKPTIGVYDEGLVQAANAQGISPEQEAASQPGGQTAAAADYTSAVTSPFGLPLIPGVSNGILIAAVAALIIIGLNQK
jgi:hypothetical protein